MSNIPQAYPAHPLGPLAGLPALAQEWRTRGAGRGATWAGLWHPRQHDEIMQVVLQHAQRVDEALRGRLARKWALPGVRDYSLLLALLPLEPNEPGQEDDAEGAASDPAAAEEAGDGDDAAPGIPIWNHGELERAKLTPVRHAVHLVRYLNDYHEPTVAAERRRRLRALSDESAEVRRAAARAVADTFLENPVRWRDVVTVAVHLACVRELEQQLGHRLRGPGHTVEQLAQKIEAGMAALSDEGAPDAAIHVHQELARRLDTLAGATAVLMYEEHEYLRLTGVRAGRSVRRHLPRGLHLIFSDQRHRREDRTAGLWLEQSTPERSTEPYHWSKGIPPAYAARRKSDYFRLENAAAVRRYVEQAEM